jgi:hypothetical protein
MLVNRLGFALLIMSILPGWVCARPQELDNTIPRILAGWKNRQGLARSARYVIVGTTEFKDFQGATPPPGDSIRSHRFEVLLDFRRGRYHVESSEDVTAAVDGDLTRGLMYRRWVRSMSYDGTNHQVHMRRDANQNPDVTDDLVIRKGEPVKRLPEQPFDAILLPVFFGHGLISTTDNGGVRPERLSMEYEPEDFEARGRQVLRGQECDVICSRLVPAIEPGHEELWVDTARGAAIRRYIGYAGKNPWSLYDVEWEKKPSGWWPVSWTYIWTMNGRVQRIYRSRVEALEIDPEVSDADFSFPVLPGMIVKVLELPPPDQKGVNPFLAASRTYRISDSGSWEEISATGFKTMSGEELPPRARWVWWAGLGGAGVALLAVAWILIRFRRRAATKLSDSPTIVRPGG